MMQTVKLFVRRRLLLAGLFLAFFLYAVRRIGSPFYSYRTQMSLDKEVGPMNRAPPAENVGFQNNQPGLQSSFRSELMEDSQFRQNLVLPDGQTNLTTKYIYLFNIQDDLQKFKDFIGCPVSACKLTRDPEVGKTADAMLVDVVRLKDLVPPSPRPVNQVWIAYGVEPPHHYHPAYTFPVWSRQVFNLTMTYRVDSDIVVPYGRLAPRQFASYKNYTDIARKKTKLAAWINHDCHSESQREVYINQLQNLMDVDIYGACGSSKCTKGADDSACLGDYFFYLAFEDAICKDYVSQQYFDVFQENMDVFPVVWGGADYSRYFPEGTYINAYDFSSPDLLAPFLKDLSSNVKAYANYLEKKDKFRKVDGFRTGWCKLCEKLHFDKTVKTYPEISWWILDGICKKPTV